MNDGEDNGCWYVNYEEYDAKCARDHTFKDASGACLPDADGRYVWFVKSKDKAKNAQLDPDELEITRRLNDFSE